MIDFLNQTGKIPFEYWNINMIRHYVDAIISNYYAEGYPPLPFAVSQENITLLEKFVGRWFYEGIMHLENEYAIRFANEEFWELLDD